MISSIELGAAEEQKMEQSGRRVLVWASNWFRRGVLVIGGRFFKA